MYAEIKQKRMNLTIDVGNTCTKLVAFDGDNVVEEVRMDTMEWDKLDDFCRKYQFERGIYSSVVELTMEQKNSLGRLSFPMMALESGITPIPIRNLYHTPTTLGSDRLAAAVGAYSKAVGHNVLIIDVGTCITYDFVNDRGEYLGGNISPGPTMRFKALHEFTGKLPLVVRKGDTPEMGVTTETAIRSGVMKGIDYEIEGYIRDYSLKYPGLLVYLTGGMHINLQSSKKNATFADDFVVPYGLNKILQYNASLERSECTLKNGK